MFLKEHYKKTYPLVVASIALVAAFFIFIITKCASSDVRCPRTSILPKPLLAGRQVGEGGFEVQCYTFSMHSLRDALSALEGTGRALWHFNFCESTVISAAARAAKEAGVPIIMGTSEGERDFLGVYVAAALVRAYRAQGVPLYLNADHTKSFEKIKEAVDAGYDSVIFDGSALSLEENIRQTRQVVEYVKTVNSRIMVEGEVGYIGTSSKLLDKVPDGVRMANVEECIRFVRETGVDILAPAVGNIHGMLKSGNEPKLDIGLIIKIKEALRQAQGKAVPLVLHGASGNMDADVRAAIAAGIGIVHVNTEIRVAWRKALDGVCAANLEETAPYKLLRVAEDAAYEVMRAKMRL